MFNPKQLEIPDIQMRKMRSNPPKISSTERMHCGTACLMPFWIRCDDSKRGYRAKPRFMEKMTFRDPDETDKRVLSISLVLDNSGPFDAPDPSCSLLQLPRGLSIQMAFALAIAFVGIRADLSAKIGQLVRVLEMAIGPASFRECLDDD